MASPSEAVPMQAPPPSSMNNADNTSDNSFTFIMHSQNTLRDGQQPETSFDDRSAARTKRRRTSPEDVAVLEEEFSRNSRPDRDERTRIARRVALGDKEVQIWFQNRRQAKRRKSRPFCSSDDGFSAHESSLPLEEGPSSDSKPSQDFLGNESFFSNMSDDSIASPTVASVLEITEEAVFKNVQTPDSEPTTQAEPREGLNSEHKQASQLAQDENPQDVQNGPDDNDKARDSRKTALRRTSSGVRLSLTSSGSAKILQEDESSPSPPKPISSPPQPEPQSSVTVARATRDRTSRQLFKSMSGRSTDARAWEFWCDADSRSQLTKVAESECSGSAADAISVMRAAGQQRSALSPVIGRRGFGQVNASSQKHEKRSGRSKSSGKPTLARARSSIAKFQTDGTYDGELLGGGNRQQTHDATAGKPSRPWPLGTRTSGSDSEKENRDPNTHRVEEPRIFGEYKKRSRPPTLGVSKSAMIEPRGARMQATGTLAPEVDLEIDAFMRSGRGSGSRSLARSKSQGAKGRDTADMDIVHGLLSLSQGNWK